MTDFDEERQPFRWSGRQKVVKMESSTTVEELERVCVSELMPLYEQAYADKTAAWARWWYGPTASKVPKGGRSYDTLRAFIVDAIKRKDDKFGGGPFVSYTDMIQATAELAKSEEVARYAPEGIRTEHVNPRWFMVAAKQFVQKQRFMDKTYTLQGVGVHYVSKVGLYLVEQPQGEPRHH